ncbi:Probable metallocarboxypeptidase A [Seminavis robusta]|uniref:Probable metallocarboxypeptidase A n=1 Tax=Seminavis robusta TaxID=568900 RepID=A0A9N8H1C4_9STRA|nr:Probable metallocarboxypeptidase A [Seminavis robusta]|eukprot:Sro14_g010800.1 Probable metallocarboxypeptidase A (678) ;mRNA; f:168483-170516
MRRILLLLQSLLLAGRVIVVAGNDQREFIALVKTTREVASTHGAVWDIQHKGSKRLYEKGDDDSREMVQLRVIVHSQDEATQLDQLESAGLLHYETSANDEDATRRNLEGINDQFSCYRTVDETYTSLDDLATRYPTFVTIDTIGESWRKQQGLGGNDIKVMILTAPSTFTKHNLMVVAGHHSRELPPPEAVMRWATHLLQNYGIDADITWILQRTQIHIVPVANPDGRDIVQNHLGWMYRKNARDVGCPEHQQGVDLNRNYPFAWGSDHGSSNSACATSYRGSSALSEPETSAVYNYAHNLFPQQIKKGTVVQAEAMYQDVCPEDTATGIFVDVHSSGDFVYFPWGFADLQSPNHRSLLTLSAKLARPGNYTLWGPGQSGFLYFVSGDATDATYGIDCIASVGYEIGSQFYASCTELKSSIVPILTESLLYAAKSVSAPYKIPLGPDILNICVDNSDPTQTTMTLKASDEALIVPWAVYDDEKDKSQAIAEVRVFWNAHPYDNTFNHGTLMAPLDGAFDSIEEELVYIMDTSGTTGQYVLYFQAKDMEGYEGAVSAVFVDNAKPQVCASSQAIKTMAAAETQPQTNPAVPQATLAVPQPIPAPPPTQPQTMAMNTARKEQMMKRNRRRTLRKRRQTLRKRKWERRRWLRRRKRRLMIRRERLQQLGRPMRRGLGDS